MATLNDKITDTTIGYKTILSDIMTAKGTEDISTIATVVPSTQSAEQYPALVGVPQMGKFKDTAEIQNLYATSYVITNEEFEASISIPLSKFEDDNLGLYDKMVRDIATNAKSHPWRLIVDLLNDAFKGKDYTGTPFISANKPYIPGVESLKNPKFTNYGKKKLSEESLAEALAQLLEMKDPYGNSIYVGSGIIPTLIVPSELEVTARKLVALEGMKDNPLYGLCKIKVVRGLTNKSAWFLADLDSECKPFIFQPRKEPALYSNSRAIASGMEDSDFIKTHKIIYQVTSRGAAAYGASSRIWGSDGSAA